MLEIKGQGDYKQTSSFSGLIHDVVCKQAHRWSLDEEFKPIAYKSEPQQHFRRRPSSDRLLSRKKLIPYIFASSQ
jgi:hypothetical protein